MTYPAPFDLSGRVVLVTGAGGGFGRQFAEVCAEAGADVVCADRALPTAETTAERVRALGHRATAVECDVTDEAAVRRMVSTAVDGHGRVDVLFNNAGRSAPVKTRLHEVTTADWRAVMDVNLDGAFFCAREVLSVMVRQGAGKIVNVASMWGTAGSSSVFPIPAYNASKGALVNLTRELGLEYARDGIQVNALCPGFYRTGFGRYEDQDFLDAVTAFIPIGRVAEATEIRGPALFLASAASDYMTGQTLIVDGGCMAK